MQITAKQQRNFQSKIDFKGSYSTLMGNYCHEWTDGLDKDGYGYFHIGLLPNRKRKRAHHIPLILDGTPIPAGHQVNHLCHNRKCVRREHLYVGTQSHNAQDYIKMGRGGKQVLKIADIPVIRARIAQGHQNIDIAKDYGIDPSVISRINTGGAWGWVP